jgi:hypothetical protein
MNTSKTNILLAIILLISLQSIALCIISVSAQSPEDFVVSYFNNYSQYDSTSDLEVWLWIKGSETHVQVTDNGDRDWYPSVAVAPNENIIVAWENRHLHYAVYDRNGGEVKPDTVLCSDAEAPSVAVTPLGNVFITYETTGGPNDIGYNITDSSGNILSSHLLGRTNSNEDPTIAASTLNPLITRVVLAWEEYNGTSWNIMFTILENDNTVVKAPTRISNPLGSIADVNAAIMPNGNIVLVWRENDGQTDQIAYAVVDIDGNLVSPAQYITSNNVPVSSRYPSVSAMTDSSIIVWQDSVPGPPYVSYALIDEEGAVTKAPSILSNFCTHADAASDVNGNVVVVYLEDHFEVGYKRVIYQVLDTNGDSIVPETPLAGGENLNTRVHGEYGMRFLATFPPPALEPVGGEMLPNTILEVSSWLFAAISTFMVSIGLVSKRKK